MEKKAAHGQTFYGFMLPAGKHPGPFMNPGKTLPFSGTEKEYSYVLNARLKEERLENPDRMAISKIEREEFSSSSVAFEMRRDAIYSGKDI